MRYFREQGKSDHEVIGALNAKFGDNYQIMTRKMVKLGGIFGVGRRTGVEYFGYIKEKTNSVAGNRPGRGRGGKSVNEQDAEQRLIPGLKSPSPAVELRASPNASVKRGEKWRGSSFGLNEPTPQQQQNSSEKEYFPVSEEEQAERDQRSREDILTRFSKNKEVQRLLREEKLVLEQGQHKEHETEERQGAVLPPVPHLEHTQQHFAGQHQGTPHPGVPDYSLPGSPPGKNPGFTPIHNPQQAARDPEFASVNYDVLTASAAGKSAPHSHGNLRKVPRDPANQENHLNAVHGLHPNPTVEPGSSSSGGSRFTGPKTEPTGSAESPAANTARRQGHWQGDFPQANYPENMANMPNTANTTNGPWENGNREPVGSYGHYAQAATEHSQGYSQGYYPQYQGDDTLRSYGGGTPRGAGVYDNGKQGYSGNPVNYYQNNPDQIETTFLRRLENLERKLDRRGSLTEPNSLNQLRESMYQNEFPPVFVDRLVSQMKRELPLEELGKLEVLWEYVLLHIAENMRFVDVQQPHSRIMVLVGPTGVGKTTTIAKLAARQCVEAMGGSKKVHLITLDNYRIGAQDQIRTYGEILGAKVDCVETTEGLTSCIAQDQESDVILIDTMGRSPGDHMKLAEMRRFLEFSGNCEIHLTVSATSGASAMREIITQFKPFGFRSVILTKLDELGRIGGTLATFLQEDIPLSYVTTGQKVPQDIRPASALVLFQQLADVQVNWQSFAQKLEENIF
ncbi:hypothetical protein P0082_10850 [Candidatus Haliotispira prima]|uniref:Flagellar biosynthesis protein FlhF n=1 Tax=Candidatus Haliotispira prima TaxID=3034016 RepID=A0ABY8MG32_9SPIO|nr:hypothetical protein P0082_10850 [Candidatus Haliotispira prima]